MLRALAASARPLSGGRALASSSTWPRAFSTDGSSSSSSTKGSGGAAPPATEAASSSGGGGGGTGGDSGGGAGAGGGQQGSAGSSQGADGWSEVVDDASGKTYWWNQQTGQTTDLGASRPTERFWRRPSAGGAGAGQHEDDAAYDDGDPHFRDAQGVWREPPGRDRTWTFSVIGVGIGMAAGWLTQYIH